MRACGFVVECNNSSSCFLAPLPQTREEKKLEAIEKAFDRLAKSEERARRDAARRVRDEGKNEWRDERKDEWKDERKEEWKDEGKDERKDEGKDWWQEHKNGTQQRDRRRDSQRDEQKYTPPGVGGERKPPVGVGGERKPSGADLLMAAADGLLTSVKQERKVA